MVYLPRFLYYLLLLLVAISISSSSFIAIVIISGIFFYLPVSITVWAFSTIYEKIFKSIDSSNNQPTASAGLKLIYVTAGIALLLITIGVTQESTRTTGYGVAAIFFVVEQVIGIKERRRMYAKINSDQH
jgi:uncharacterized membrane protein